MYYIVSVDEGRINLVDASGEVTGIDGNPIRIDPTGTTTQPISADSLPLPTGAATSALQSSGNVSLTSIDGKLNSLGQKAMAASLPVVLASDQVIPVTFSVQGPPARTIINLQWDDNFNNSKSTTWEPLVNYVVPTGYAVSLISFLSVNNSTACQNRMIAKKILATYNVGTNTFVNVFASTAPKFYSRLEVVVTADNTGGTWVMTITYTNQDGITGRTATVSITNTFDVPHHYKVNLQTGDYGVMEVTNITRDNVRTGTFSLVGVDEISYYDTEAAWRVNEKVYGKDTLVFGVGDYDELSIQRYSDNTTSLYTRSIACFTIYPQAG